MARLARALTLGLGIAAMFAPSAGAGYPVQPYNGRELVGEQPNFLVYTDPDESLQRVEVSRNADGTGYEGSCTPSTPFGEANKFTCRLFWELDPGTYYWIFSFWKRDDCVTYSFGTYCYLQKHEGPAWQFTIREKPKPVDIVSLPTISGPSSRSRVQPFYGRIATVLADQPVTVNCWSRADWARLHSEWNQYEPGGGGLTAVLGYVRPDEPGFIQLAPDVCARLDLLAYQRKTPRNRTIMRQVAFAVSTLAHEAMHVRGLEDEAETQCVAMQLTEVVTQSLGVGGSYGFRLGQVLWAFYRYELMPEGYWTPLCYDGGSLDIYPDTSAWP